MNSALYAPVRSAGQMLRVGVMLNDWMPPAWVAQILQDIQSSQIARICTVIVNANAAASPRESRHAVLRELRRRTHLTRSLWDWYVRHDERRNSALTSIFRAVDVRELLAEATALNCWPLESGVTHRFTSADVEAIRAQKLDVVLRFGFNIIRGEILTVARHGVWSYHHGDNRAYRGGPAAFWEMYERNPVTGVILQVLRDELDGGDVIYRSLGATHSFESLLRNRAPQYRKGTAFVMRCLRQLYQTGKLSMEAPGPAYDRGIYRRPSNLQTSFFLIRAIWRSLRARTRHVMNIKSDHWQIAVVPGETARPDWVSSPNILPAPKGHFWADPFVIEREGRQWVFFEDLHYADGRGRIAMFELGANFTPGPVETVLDEPWHLSYPFVFHWQGNDYMIPECASSRSVRLYRAVDFPVRWEFDRTLLDNVHAVDATLHEEDGIWYLFTNISESGGSTWDELFLFTAPTPLGPWSPHPKNPIVSDVRSARPAGPLFKRGGILYRPAQDCSTSYGAGIIVNRVRMLSQSEYEETSDYSIGPPTSKFTGCHTISITRRVTFLDLKCWQWVP